MRQALRLFAFASGLAGHCLAQVPSANPPKRAVGNGLKGEYFSGYAFNKLVGSRIDPAINAFYDGHKPPMSGVTPEVFSIRWSGQLLAPVPGRYMFTVIADDGIRVTIGGRVVLQNWRDKGRRLVSIPVNLQSGKFYEIRVDYVNYSNGGFVDLDWDLPRKELYSMAGFMENRTIIPTAYLFSDPVETPKNATLSVAKKSIPKSTTVSPVVAVKKPAPKPPIAKSTVTALTASKPVTPPVITPINPFNELTDTGKQSLNQVVFEQSSSTLRPESYPELNQLADLLKRMPTLRIDVSGHTDNVGDSRLNQTLSEYRAKVVASYLSRRGVDERRITTHGYGGSRPVTNNDSDASRARNRRVEISVVP